LFVVDLIIPWTWEKTVFGRDSSVAEPLFSCGRNN